MRATYTLRYVYLKLTTYCLCPSYQLLATINYMKYCQDYLYADMMLRKLINILLYKLSFTIKFHLRFPTFP